MSSNPPPPPMKVCDCCQGALDALRQQMQGEHLDLQARLTALESVVHTLQAQLNAIEDDSESRSSTADTMIIEEDSQYALYRLDYDRKPTTVVRTLNSPVPPPTSRLSPLVGRGREPSSAELRRASQAGSGSDHGSFLLDANEGTIIRTTGYDSPAMPGKTLKDLVTTTTLTTSDTGIVVVDVEDTREIWHRASYAPSPHAKPPHRISLLPKPAPKTQFFGDYELEKEPRKSIVIDNKKSEDVAPQIVEAVMSDMQAYDEMIPSRTQLRSALQLEQLTVNSEGNWLERFLYASGQSDLGLRNKYLLEFSKDFIRQATTRARIILQEFNVPIHKKSIPPLGIGGIGGGTKYLDQSILFKFADDPTIGGNRHLYGGVEADPERAAKAAANDLKGADAYFRCFAMVGRIPVVVPPQVVMDFNGHRLVAMPFLPLSECKLVYGSDNGGKTVHDDDEVMQSALKFAAHHLHLERHWVRDKRLYAAGDIEAHMGKDGRRYLVDLARTFPPEDPGCSSHLPHVHSSVFFRLHRAAFMEYLKSKHDNAKFPPLSSDAYSLWGSRIDAATHNQNAKNATVYLLETRVSELVSFLQTDKNQTQNLGQVLQRWGISVRHMGLVRSRVRALQKAQPNPYNADLERQLLLSMVARCCKNLLRQDLREASLSKNVNDAIAAFLNSLTCHSSEESFSFWAVKLPKDVVGRFGAVALDEGEEQRLLALCKPGIGTVLKYVCAQTGITLTATAQAWNEENFYFTRQHVLSTSVRSKTFSVLEDLLQEDNINQACECRTRNDFVMTVTKLARKATEDLAYLVNIITEPDELLVFFKTRAGAQGQSIQLLTLAALGLFFAGKEADITEIISTCTERWAISLIARLPQIFSPRQQEQLVTSRLLALCHQEHLAVGTTELAQALLQAKANPNAKSEESKDSVLFLSVARGHDALVEILLEAKADPTFMDACHRSVEQIALSYPAPTSRIAELLGVTVDSEDPSKLLLPVRVRVHLLALNKPLSDAAMSIFVAGKLLTLKVKLPGGGHRFRQAAPVVGAETSKKTLLVYADFLFESWHPANRLKCTLFRNNKRVHTVKLSRPETNYVTFQEQMEALTPDTPSLVLMGDIMIAPPRWAESPKSMSPPALPSVKSSLRMGGLPPPPIRSQSLFVKTHTKLFSGNKTSLRTGQLTTLANLHAVVADTKKVIVLGPGSCGKTTMVRRLCGPVSPDEYVIYVDIIRRNVVCAVQTYLSACAAKMQMLLPENVRSGYFVAHVDVLEVNPKQFSQVLPHLLQVMGDPGFQKTLMDRTAFLVADSNITQLDSAFQLSESCGRFFPKISEIFAPDYVPTYADCLACHLGTTGIIERKVQVGPHSVRLFDVGGSQIARRKWAHLYPDAHAVIYTVNVSCDDRVGEDKHTNRMAEALSVWAQVTSSDALKDARFFLLFTFEDQFQRKINQPDEGTFFADIFAKRPSLAEAKEAVAQRFMSQISLGESSRVKCVFVDLFDDASFAACLNALTAFLDNR